MIRWEVLAIVMVKKYYDDSGNDNDNDNDNGNDSNNKNIFC